MGNQMLVGDLGVMWRLHASSFQLIAAVKLSEYAARNDFLPSEIQAYKKGLSEFPIFLEACQKESELEILKLKKAN